MARGPVRGSRAFPGRRSSSSSTWTLVLAMLLMLSVVLLMLLGLGIFSLPVSTTESPELKDTAVERRLEETPVATKSNGLGQRGGQWTEVLSWEPRAFVYHNFLVVVIRSLTQMAMYVFAPVRGSNKGNRTTVFSPHKCLNTF